MFNDRRGRYNTLHQHSKIRGKGDKVLTLMICKIKFKKTFCIFFVFILVVVQNYYYFFHKPIMSFWGGPLAPENSEWPSMSWYDDVNTL